MSHQDKTNVLFNEVMNDFDKMFDQPNKYTCLIFSKDTQTINVIGGKQYRIINNGVLTITVKDKAVHQYQYIITDRMLHTYHKILTSAETPDQQTTEDQSLVKRDKDELHPADDSFKMILRLTAKNMVSFYSKGGIIFKSTPSNLTLSGLFETKNQVYLMHTVSDTDELVVGITFKTKHSPDHLYKSMLEGMKGGADIG